MAEYIGISKAARLMGMTRSALSKRLETAGIGCFEGKVPVDALAVVAPTWELRDAGFNEDIRFLREGATHAGPSAGTEEELAAQLRKTNSELVVASGRARHFEAVFADLLEWLGEAQVSDDDALRRGAMAVNAWLVERLKA